MHSNIVDLTFYACRKAHTREEKEQAKQHRSECLDFDRNNCIANSHKGNVNVVDNVERLTEEEIVRKEKGGHVNTARMRVGQKSIKKAAQMVETRTLPGQVVVDFFCGTGSTAKGCLALDQHRLFYGCDNDYNCVQRACQTTALVYATQVCHNTASSLHVSDPMTAVIKDRDARLKACQDLLQLESKHQNLARTGWLTWQPSSSSQSRRNKHWQLPHGLPPYQKLPEHIRNALATATRNPIFVQDNDSSVYQAHNHCSKPVHNWTDTAQNLFNSTPIDILLTTDSVHFNVYIAPSKIKHKDAGLGVFASNTIKAHTLVGFFYGTLVYSDLGEAEQTTLTYGHGHLGTTKQRFLDYALRVGEITHKDPLNPEKHSTRKPVFIVPAPFSCMGFLNSPDYRNGDSEKSLSSNTRTANVYIKQRKNANNIRQERLTNYTLVEIHSKTIINKNEELFLNYNICVWEFEKQKNKNKQANYN